MFRYVPIFALVSCAISGTVPDKWEGRIVNGEETTIKEHPYQVSIQNPPNSHFCGGSLMNEDTIVTAAHCLVGETAADIQVRLGSSTYKTGGELVAVKSFKIHEGYNSRTKANDVAVIKLASPVRETSSIRYIELAEKTPATGTPAVVTGWGVKCSTWCMSLSPNLLEVGVDIVDRNACASNTYKYGNQITDTMVCAHDTKKDACQGDSGGPLVANNKLVGIVSWGNGCARSGYPGVYADVPVLRGWIVSAAKQL